MASAAKKAAAAELLIVDRNAFAAALKLLKDTVRSGSVPILETVLIEPVDAAFVSLTVTNSERQMTMRVAAMSSDTFEACCISHDRLSVAVDGLYGSDVRMVVEGGHATLHARNGGRRKLQTLPADQFPRMGADGLSPAFALDADDLDDAIAFAMPAMHTDTQVAPHMCGVSVRVIDGALVFAGLDGNRLHRHEVDGALLADLADGLADTIWPDKFVATSRTMLARHKGQAVVEQSAALVRLTTGSTTLLSKLIEGTFPNTELVIDRSRAAATSTLAVHSAELARALGAVSRLVDNKTERGPVVELRVAEAGCEVRMTGTTEGEEPIDATDYPHPELRIGFAANLLANAARSFGETALSVRFGDASSPIVLTAEAQPHRLALVMPTRI